MHALMHLALAHEAFKPDYAVHLGEQGKVAAHTHVFTGENPGAELTHDNVAREHMLAAETLHAAPLAGAVAAVAGAAACFFMIPFGGMVYWELMTYFRIFIIKTETKTEHQIIRGLEILKIVADVKE